MTKYIVLKRSPDDDNTWVVAGQDVEGRDAGEAIKQVAITGDAVNEGVYVGVAASGFRPRNVKKVVQLQVA